MYSHFYDTHWKNREKSYKADVKITAANNLDIPVMACIDTDILIFDERISNIPVFILKINEKIVMGF